MNSKYNLKRFTDARQRVYPEALSEIRRGKKVSHWMWYIFPQIRGLGLSETSKYYAIENIHEAEEFLKHPALGPELINICQALLDLKINNATAIFGVPDNVKLKSSMTLFASVPGANPIFEKVLDKFFYGEKDGHTLAILHQLSINPG